MRPPLRSLLKNVKKGVLHITSTYVKVKKYPSRERRCVRYVEFDGACIIGVGDLGIVSAFSADDPNESCRVSASSNLDDDAGEDLEFGQ